MYKQWNLFALLLLLATLLNGCLNAAITSAGLAYDHNNVSRKLSDFYLKTQIQNKLSTKNFEHCRIAVTVFQGIVLLTGQVSNEQLKQDAQQIAQQTDGVKRIYNRLAIGAPISLQQQANDSWITTKVKTKIIAAKDTDPETIKVVTENAVVYLIGLVTKKQENIAIELTKNTSGVKKIVLIFFYITMPDLSATSQK